MNMMELNQKITYDWKVKPSKGYDFLLGNCSIFERNKNMILSGTLSEGGELQGTTFSGVEKKN